jgi:hypothetical protein
MNLTQLHLPRLRAIAALAFLALASPNAFGQLIISNGGFESGFSGWTLMDQLGSEGTFFVQTGTISPVNGNTVQAPPEGNHAAMTDAQGPGSHVLFQDFVVPSFPVPDARLRVSLFIGNRASAFFTPNPPSLDFSTPTLNQQARIDILNTGANPFSVSASDVLLNAYQTSPGDPLISGYSLIDVDLAAVFAANMGNTLRLRFAEVDNVFTFQMGVDNVSIAVPEPSAMILCGIGGLIGWCRRMGQSKRGLAPEAV